MKYKILLALFLATGWAYAGPKTLQDYQDIYQRELDKIDKQCGNTFHADQRYTNSLENIRINAVRKANVALVKAILDEQERFKTFNDITSEVPEEIHVDIKLAQKKYQEEVNMINAYKDAKVITLSQKYINGLKSYARYLLKNGNIEEAELVSKEIQKIETKVALLLPKPKKPVEKKPVEKKELKFTLVKYGKDNRYVDLTEEFNAEIKFNKFRFKIDDLTVYKGNPVPGKAKELIIEYIYNGEKHKRTIYKPSGWMRAGNTISLP